jgi:hypothetical protein
VSVKGRMAGVAVAETKILLANGCSAQKSTGSSLMTKSDDTFSGGEGTGNDEGPAKAWVLFIEKSRGSPSFSFIKSKDEKSIEDERLYVGEAGTATGLWGASRGEGVRLGDNEMVECD